MNEWMDKKFRLLERDTSFGQEFRAASATFLTMSYILLVNPQLLNKIGIPSTDVVVSTALASAVGSFIAGYFGNLPLGLAPGIGLSAYLTYGLILGDGLSVQEAFTSCFVSGLLLLVLSVTGLSSIVMKLIPRSVKLATIVGMGLQIALVGMTSVKMVVPNEQTIVGLGDVTSSDVWLSVIGLVLIGSLLYHQVRGGILIGIFVMTILDWIMKDQYPSSYIDLPNLAVDVSDFVVFDAFSFQRCTAGVLAFLFIGVIDVSGVIFGMASLAKLTDDTGHIPGATPTFIAVALSTLVSAITGGTPIIVYVESAAGIKEGGRTGLTALLISLFFVLSLFFAPVLSDIPLIATAPVSILVGAMMMSQAVEIDWNNMSEAIPAFLTLITMPFTFSITNGIVLGLITAFMFYITTGQFFYDIASVFGYGTQSSSGGASRNKSGSDPAQPSFPSNSSGGSKFSSDSPQYGESSSLLMGSATTTNGNSNSNSGSKAGSRRPSTGSQGGGGGGGAEDEGKNQFLDDEPFVRTPSLILRRRDAEAVRLARGNSIGRDDGHAGYERQSSQNLPNVTLDVSEYA
mmetsp:Transcript_1487/g.2489  ORF Transcript_1487/g.2489 Transcript_1487/m.2489 type:complete len:572 (-) Transcript_1487:2014-3729(-)